MFGDNLYDAILSVLELFFACSPLVFLWIWRGQSFSLLKIMEDRGIRSSPLKWNAFVFTSVI